MGARFNPLNFQPKGILVWFPNAIVAKIAISSENPNNDSNDDDHGDKSSHLWTTSHTLALCVHRPEREVPAEIKIDWV